MRKPTRLAMTLGMGLLILFSAIPAEADNVPRVLVINSYHRGFPWSDTEEAGFTGRVREIFPELDIPVEYLDAKRNSGGAHQLRMKDFLAEKYRRVRFDVIAALDNPAMDLLTRYREELFPDVPVVFAGIGDHRQYLATGRGNITGVVERQDVRNTLDTALALHPAARKIFVINDDTVTGLSSRRDTESLAPSFAGRADFRFLAPGTFEETLAAVRALSPDTILLIQSYANDSTGRTIPVPESTRAFVSAANVPTYALHEIRLGHGIVGGFLLEGNAHGRMAAGMALRVLTGIDPSTIPVEEATASRPMFDFAQLKRFGIPVGKLPPGSVVVNRPESIFETHKRFAIGNLLVSAALASLVVFLVITVLRLRRAKEETLRKTEELDRIFRLSLDLLCIASIDGRFIRLNPAWEHILGYRKEEMEGRMFMDFVHPDDVQATAETVAELGAGKEVIDFTNRYRCRDGSYRWIEWRSAPYRGETIYAAARDVTERRAAEKEQARLSEQLFQSQKMETVGLLAGGVAHDFNNLLTPIMGYSELMLHSLPETDPNRPRLEHIRQAADMAKTLTMRLLAFSRKQMLRLDVVDLGDIVRDLEPVVRRTIREDIRIRVAAGETPGLARADRGQMEQALLNLAINAQDAMPEGGTLAIEAENVDIDDLRAAGRPEVVPGPYVMLSVSDTGTGMDSETQAHIFEPFFTTKGPGKGTGLGLATVYGIVKQHGGHIYVHSEPGMGSVFKMYLPRVENASRAADVPEAVPGRPERGDETVLVAEDNGTVRALACRMLEGLGYRVLASETADHCVELARSHPGPIHLLLTDVIMPGKNGMELYSLLKGERPEMKALFMSGYTGDVIGRHGILDEGVNFLQKPFTNAVLSHQVRRALES